MSKPYKRRTNKSKSLDTTIIDKLFNTNALTHGLHGAFKILNSNVILTEESLLKLKNEWLTGGV
jgi:hypothetical protein